MALYLPVAEPVGTPPTGQRALAVDADGAAYLLLPDGSRVLISAGAATVTVGAPLDGDGSVGDPIVIPNFSRNRIGALLTDADVTLNPKTDKCSLYIMPAGTLTAPRTITVTNADGDTTQVCQILRIDVSAHALTIRNNVPTTLYTAAGSLGTPVLYQLYHSGGIWNANSIYYTQIT